MQARRVDAHDSGFGLIEVIISMLILGMIAVAIIPALWQGIQYSSEQSAVATATRQLNALIEEARRSPSCGTVAFATAAKSFEDGAGRPFTTVGALGGCFPCAAATGIAVPLTVTATQNGRQLADVSARIFVRGAQVSPCTP